jgi:hypothetical protein
LNETAKADGWNLMDGALSGALWTR